MTRYSRSVIPGRASGEPISQEIDSLVFGRKGRVANDEDDDLDEVETDHLVKRANADRRSKSERRSAKGRRQADFAPLPGEGRGLRAEASKRGPILLVGAAVVVAVFGVVVWNAYREGVRPQDSNTAPRLAEAGAFKSKPAAAVVDEPNSAVEASVFEQVEARKPVVEPAPEVREESRPAPTAVAPPPAPPLPSRAFEKPVQGPAQTAAPAKSAPASAKTAPQPAATQPAAAKPAAIKPTATKPAAAKPAATKPAAPVAPPVQPAVAPKPEAVSLIGAGAYAPAFAADGKYVVQVAAASSEAGANAEWAKRAKAMPELFPAAAEKIVVQADVGGRTVYRVRVGAFASAADADAFCSAIKAKGGACFRTAR